MHVFTRAQKPHSSHVHDVPARQCVGIDIAEDGLRYVSLSRQRNRVSAFGIVPLPQGLIDNGFISDPEQFGQALKRIGRNTHIKNAHCAVSEALVSRFSIPVPASSSERDIRNIIGCSLEEYVPYSIHEVVFSYAISEINQRAGHATVQVTVFPQKHVSRVQRMCAAAKLNATYFEGRADAITRAVIPVGDMSPHLIVDLGVSEVVSICVISGRVASVNRFPVEAPEALAADIEQHVCAHALSTIHVTGAPAGPVSRALSRHVSVPVREAQVWENVCQINGYVPPITKADAPTYAAAIGLALEGR